MYKIKKFFEKGGGGLVKKTKIFKISKFRALLTSSFFFLQKPRMRPDNHKAKESRRYQARKKKEGDTEAADVAEARRKAAKARDRGLGQAAVMRRNADPSEETEEEKEERKAHQAKFARRKLETNADRYKEVTEQGK